MKGLEKNQYTVSKRLSKYFLAFLKAYLDCLQSEDRYQVNLKMILILFYYET